MKNELQTKETSRNLETTTFDFYGDELIAVRDESTGEIYTSINEVLRGIGFSDKDQIRKRRDKWINDVVISKGIVNFNIPVQEVVAKKDTTIVFKDTYCISQRKLPLALAKISVTPRMRQLQPELSSRLEIYQDKCADVLASVFIDKQQPDVDSAATNNTLAEILHTLKFLVNEVDGIKHNMSNNQSNSNTNNNNILSDNNSKQKSIPINSEVWFRKLQPKYNLLKIKYNADSYRHIYSIIYNLLRIKHSVDFDILQEEYCNKHNVDKCYLQEAIFDNHKIRNLYEEIVDKLLVS